MQWYEIWSDESFEAPYLLILSDSENGEFIITDPKENGKIVFRTSKYEEAKLWLLEDEYTLVDGRMTD
ncbi:MAG: hypothetical protein JKX81_20065 [Arenicella sp.]|nr:hypothetical protein [Arenicella sp.]